ncbi:hypothetical protein BH23GEM7_BH23GEM7_00550 [soil metagenome]
MPRRPVKQLLRLPLFFKLLLAGGAIVFSATFVCGLIALRLAALLPGTPSWAVLGVISVAAAAVALPLQALVLRLALRPLDLLAAAAERVERGEVDARAPRSPLADPQLERLAGVFNRALDRMAADRTRLQAVAARAFHAQEAERIRLAGELRDQIAQDMATMLLQLRVARQASDRENCDELLDRLRQQLSLTTEAVRNYARGLHPPALRELGLVAALEALGRSVAEQTGLRVEIEAEGVRSALTPQGELGVYRIVQEALTNAVRHAEAMRVNVALQRRGAELLVMVEDDGHGFDLDEAEQRGGCLGIYGMQERALYLGGSIEVESAPGEGTSVRIRIPVEGGGPAKGERGNGIAA